MADVEINKAKTEKTSASVTSTLPRLCPETDIYSKDTGNDTERGKSLSPRNRPISDESKKRSGLVDFTKVNLHKSILTEFRNSEPARLQNSSLTSISPRDYRGLIPIPKKHSSNSVGMSPPITRSPSPIIKHSPKEKSSSKIKTISLDQDAKKKQKITNSRSPSPIKRTPGTYKKSAITKPRPPSPGLLKTPERTTVIKRSEATKQNISPRTSSPPKRKPKAKVSSVSNVECIAKEKSKKESERIGNEVDTIVLKQASQPSLCKKEIGAQPQEKISLDHLKNKVFSGDHKRLSYEKVQLCIEKSMENVSLAESKRRYLVTYSAENLKKQKGISVAFVQNISSKSITNLVNDSKKKPDPGSSTILESKDAIRTLSGEELILSPSIKEMENGEIGCEDLEISKLLHESGMNFEEQKDVHVIQDDANEYDSEISTDGEAQQQMATSANNVNEAAKKSALWKSREAELLNDVDYRQSVYHPAVSRRQDMARVDFRPKSKSIEDNYGFGNNGKERIVRTRSSQLKNKYSSHKYSLEKDENIDGSWCTNFDKTAPLFSSTVQDVPLYDSLAGVERIRTKRQRLSGAMLRLTLKIIRLLALFNLWPGDFSHMLTSQSLRLAR